MNEPAVKPKRPFRSILRWTGLFIVLVLGIVFYFRYYWVFGKGAKSGELNYVVYKGFLCKTYEGKLIQSGLKGSAGSMQSNEFIFSVEDERIARELMANVGRVFKLHVPGVHRRAALARHERVRGGQHHQHVGRRAGPDACGAGVAAMAVGAIALVEGIRRISSLESTQTVLGLTVVGFATAFELVALAWSSSRRGISTAVVAAVVGSFTYNLTMTLGAGALDRPLVIIDATSLHVPWILMLASLALALVLAVPHKELRRGAGLSLLAAYPLFVAWVVFTS